ncbi:MAG: hypothetical protein ACON4Z_17005 [Planctomycetota bacterium]
MLLLSGASIGSWLLPAALIVAALLKLPALPNLGHPALTSLAVVGSLAITYGSVATLDRSWDGLATWTANARWLAVDGSLNHPYFSDSNVFNYARGYPLFQPILLALGIGWLGDHGARVLFPLLWLLLTLALPAPLRRAGLNDRAMRIAVSGLLLVPFFLEPGGGGADSGFADLLVAALLLHAVIGLTEDRPGLTACACLLLPMAKVEGTIHVLNILIIAALSGRRRSAVGGTVGGTIGLALTVPLQHLVRQPDFALPAESLVQLLAPASVLLLGTALRTLRSRSLALASLVIALAALILLGRAADTPAAWGLPRLLQIRVDIAAIPQITGHGLLTLVQVKEFGLTFGLTVATGLVVAWRQSLGPLRPLVAVQLIGFAAVVVYLSSRPAEVLDLFLREGLPRYLAQWVGAAWLFIGLGWARIQPTEHEAEG